MRKKIYLNDPEFDKRIRNTWRLLRNNNPFKGMSTMEILKKVREEP
ncbi:MAG: hypothetical protein KJ955_07635 [Nanoarchaeota archaeon]|nr:hypothetical protein [Nanoarchaeota archaeon]